MQLNNLIKRVSKLYFLIGVIAGILAFSFLFLFFANKTRVSNSRNEKRIYDKRADATVAVGKIFFGAPSAILSLTQCINRQNGQVHDFNFIGPQIISGDKYIHFVALQPNGITKYVYPLQGNEELIGKSILYNTDQNIIIDATRTRESKRSMFSTPFKNFAGDSVICCRMPVFIEGNFWGFATVGYLVNDIIKGSGLTSEDIDGFQYALSYKNPVTN